MSILKKSKSGSEVSTSGLKKSRRIFKKSKSVTEKPKFSQLRLHRDIMREGRVLNRHPGAMEIVADKVVKEVTKWAKERDEVSKEEVDRATAARIRKYDADLAYLYRMRGKWI